MLSDTIYSRACSVWQAWLDRASPEPEHCVSTTWLSAIVQVVLDRIKNGETYFISEMNHFKIHSLYDWLFLLKNN